VHHPSDPGYAEDGTTVISAVDWLGNRFYVGDTVLYCVAAGRGQMMATGVVKIIRCVSKTRTRTRRAGPGETPTRWTEPANHCDPLIGWVDEVVPWDDLTVQVLTTHTSGGWNHGQRQRPAWVNPMNITSARGLETAVSMRTELESL